MRPTTTARRIAAAAASAAVAVVLFALLLPALAAAGPLAARSSDPPIIKFQDYTLKLGETASTVVVIGGDAVIAGTVTQNVVVIGGNVDIRPSALVGTSLTRSDSSIVVIGGHATVESGASVRGKTVEVTGLHIGGLSRALASDAFVRPFGLIAVWWQLLFLPIVALVVSALLPRQVRAVGRRARLRPWPSLGWGALGLLLTGVLLVVLAITIVGLIVVVPVALVLPGLLLFCVVAVAAIIGERLVQSSERYRANIIVAAVVGALLLSVIQLVPVIGGLATVLVALTGFGAMLSAFVEWRRGRGAGAQPAVAGPAPQAPPAYPPQTPPPYPPQAPPTYGPPQPPAAPQG